MRRISRVGKANLRVRNRETKLVHDRQSNRLTAVGAPRAGKADSGPRGPAKRIAARAAGGTH